MLKKSEPQIKVVGQSSLPAHTRNNDHASGQSTTGRTASKNEEKSAPALPANTNNILSPDLFNQLSNLATSSTPQTVADVWATGYGINEILKRVLGNRVHIIDPTSSSVSSPASQERRNAMDGAVNYAKMIGGFTIVNNGEEIQNGFINEDGGTLTKPIIMVINTTPVKVGSSQDSNVEGGVHWQCCVILPTNYQPIFGTQLNNPNEIIFYLDSYYPNIKLPKAFHFLLKSPTGLNYSFESSDGKRTHRLPALFPNATIVDDKTTNQQLQGNDCGWWALYNALMIVFTGNIDFLQQFKAPAREPAFKLRNLFPDLTVQQPAPVVAKKPQEKKSPSRENDEDSMDENESLALQQAIENSLKDLNLGSQGTTTGSTNQSSNKKVGKGSTSTQQQDKKKQSKEEYFKALKKQRKREDLDALYKMWKAMSEFKIKALALDKVVGRVSHLSGGAEGIAFNDNYDKETYAIRNRYGYRQRNLKQENPNKEGRIDFEQLFKLNVILKCGILLPQEVAAELDILEAKVIYILSKELKVEPILESDKTQEVLNLGEQKGNAADLVVISKFVQTNYQQVVLEKVKSEVVQFKDFALNDRNSIYFFARKMVIIGELCHELEQEIKDDEGLKDLRKLFGILNNIRNGFIHFHSKILFNLSPAKVQQANQFFQEFIGTFSELLSEDLFQSGTKDPKKLGECIKALSELNRKLIGNSKYKVQYQLEAEVLRAKQVLDVLDSNEYKNIFLLCDKEAANLNPKLAEIIKTCKDNGNISYLFQIEKILEKESKLGDSSKSQLKAHLITLKAYIKDQNLQDLANQYTLLLEDEENKEYLKEALGEEFEDFDIKDVKQIKDSIVKFKTCGSETPEQITTLFQQAINTLTNSAVSMPQLSSIDKRFKDIKKKINDLDEEDKAPLLERFDFEISLVQKQNINKLAETIILKAKPNNKLLVLLEKLNKEMQYLSVIEGDDKLSVNTKNAIIEHIVTVVGQYIRELEELQPLDQALPSRVLKEAGVTSKTARSKGLAHEVLYFYQDTFLRNLYEDILPAQLDFQAAYTIGKDSLVTVPRTAMLNYRLGMAFMRLCLYEEATKYFEAGLKDVRDNPQLEGTIHPRSKLDQYKIDDMGITQPTIICMDMTKLIFGVDSYELKVVSGLVSAYVGGGQVERAQVVANDLLKRMNLKEVQRYRDTLVRLTPLILEAKESNDPDLPALNKFLLEMINPNLLATYQNIIKIIMGTRAPYFLHYPPDNEIFEEVSAVVSSVGHAFCEQRNYRAAAEVFEQVLGICGSKESHAATLINLAQCYKALKDFNKAREVIEYARADSSAVSQFMVELSLCEMKLEEKAATHEEVTKLEKHYQRKKGKLKEEAGDRYTEYLLRLYLLKVRFLAQTSGHTAVKEFYKQAKQAIDILNDEEKKKLYSCGSHELSGLLPSSVVNPDAQEILESAQAYFDLANSTFGNADTEEKEAASNLAKAYSNYATLQKHHPKEHLCYLQKALELQEKYDLDKSITLVNIAGVYHNLGEDSYKKKKFEQAAADYKKCIEYVEKVQSLESAEGFHILGSAYGRLDTIGKKAENLKKAIGSLKKAVELAPQDLIYQGTLTDCHNEYKVLLEKQKVERVLANQDLQRLLVRYELYNRNSKNLQGKCILTLDKVTDMSAFTTVLHSLGIPGTAIVVKDEKNKTVTLDLKQDSRKIIDDWNTKRKEQLGR